MVEKHLGVLLKDLDDLNIGLYLTSTHFTRMCINKEFEIIWDKSYHEAFMKEGRYTLPEEETAGHSLSICLRYLIENEPIKFQQFVSSLILDFLNISKSELLIDNVLKDLKLLKFNSNLLEEIEIQYLIHKNNFTKGTISNENGISVFETKKKNWKKSISKAEIEKVVDEIIEFSVENENDFIGISRRWHTLKNDYHKGVLKRDEYEIENNKITDALLNFIKNIKNTEGS